MLYKHCFDLLWAATLGAYTSSLVSLAHTEGRAVAPLANIALSRSLTTGVKTVKTLCKVNCRINYFMNDTAILLSPPCGIVQAVKTVAPVTCADILFCLNDLWHQLIKLTAVCLITSRHSHCIINVPHKGYTFPFVRWIGYVVL